MPTPHNSAPENAFAKTVLMPGDPKRSHLIAHTYLENPQLVNDVRGVQGYTGTYHGAAVSVMASGMGIPSMAIYSYELYQNYGVENIIRIGSAGAISDHLKLREVIAAIGACTDSNYGAQFGLHGCFAPVCSYALLSAAASCAENLGMKLPVGNIYTTDAFYDISQTNLDWGRMGVLAVDMETAGLYCNAAYTGKNALSLLSISDHLITKEALPADDRRTSFHEMILLALSVAEKVS